jgi:hypothetical protein
MQPYGFPHAPFHSVANHRFTCGSRHRKTNSCAGRLVTCETKRREIRARDADTLIIDLAEVAAPEYPDILREAESLSRRQRWLSRVWRTSHCVRR